MLWLSSAVCMWVIHGNITVEDALKLGGGCWIVSQRVRESTYKTHCGDNSLAPMRTNIKLLTSDWVGVCARHVIIMVKIRVCVSQKWLASEFSKLWLCLWFICYILFLCLLPHIFSLLWQKTKDTSNILLREREITAIFLSVQNH